VIATEPAPRRVRGVDTADAVDAVVVGGGPNGLAAAITLARAGHSVTVLEAAATIGGGARSAELTLPGFVHDVCSDLPLRPGVAVCRGRGARRYGLRWIEPPASLGHPLDDGTAVIVERDVEATAAGLGRDRDAYRRLFGPLVRDFDALLPDALAPFHVPLSRQRAIRLGLFGLNALQSATSLSKRFGERWKRLPAPRPRWPLAGYRSGPSSSSPSRASSIDRERPRAGTRSGRIATSRTARPST
jgi:phytoene dehydrogenase-like protein